MLAEIARVVPLFAGATWEGLGDNGKPLLAETGLAIEHTLTSVKRLRTLRGEFRNRRRGMIDAIMGIGCTLHNYRWTCWQPPPERVDFRDG